MDATARGVGRCRLWEATQEVDAKPAAKPPNPSFSIARCTPIAEPSRPTKTNKQNPGRPPGGLPPQIKALAFPLKTAGPFASGISGVRQSSRNKLHFTGVLSVRVLVP